MDLPDLVRQALGDEEIAARVSLGDDDALYATRTQSLVYRGEGLLSDEAVSAYPHEFERLAVSEGRRKTKFTLTYVDSEETFGVPVKRTNPVLERLLEGNLQVAGVLDGRESVTGVFRFSELTLVVAQQRLLKHVGGYTWDGDFEGFPFDDVTGLHFEQGSVATAVVLEVDRRPERIKAPNEEARLLRQALESALFEYYDVDSLDALNQAVAVEPDGEEADEPTGASASGLDLEAGIDPLTGGDEREEAGQTTDSPAADDDRSPQGTTSATEPSGGVQTAVDASDVGATGEDLADVTDQLAELTAAVERQNELVEKQHRTVEQLIEELRRGR